MPNKEYNIVTAADHEVDVADVVDAVYGSAKSWKSFFMFDLLLPANGCGGIGGGGRRKEKKFLEEFLKMRSSTKTFIAIALYLMGEAAGASLRYPQVWTRSGKCSFDLLCIYHAVLIHSCRLVAFEVSPRRVCACAHFHATCSCIRSLSLLTARRASYPCARAHTRQIFKRDAGTMICAAAARTSCG